MSEEAKRNIQKGKQELHQAEKAHQKWILLSAKREDLDLKEQELVEKFHSDTLFLHRLRPDEREKMAQIQTRISQQEDLIHQLKRKKQEIDALLDTLEDISDEKINFLKEKLIKDILKEFPDQCPVYHTLHSHLELQQSYENELIESLNTFKQLTNLLEPVLAIRQTVRRRGIFSYILGTNPNASISQHLQAAGSLSSLALPHFESRVANGLGAPHIQEKYQEIILFLKEFQQHCKMRWGFRHIDTTFSQALEKIKQFQTLFENESQKQSREKKIALQRIEAWIEDQS